jgi:glucan phosphoethanolaminetransferase (alkaline phosphatase superfamily)
MDDSLIYLAINIILWIYFLSVYYEEKNTLFAVFQFMVSLPLILTISALSYFNSSPVGYLVSFSIILCSFFTLVFSYYEKNKKNKK